MKAGHQSQFRQSNSQVWQGRVSGLPNLFASLGVVGLLLQGCYGPGQTAPPPNQPSTTAPLTVVVGQPETPSTAPARTGAQVYLANCAACHGDDGAGGINFGAVRSSDLRQVHLGPAYTNDRDLLSRAILDGINERGRALDAVMPRWRDRLSAAEAETLIAYLQALG